MRCTLKTARISRHHNSCTLMLLARWCGKQWHKGQGTRTYAPSSSAVGSPCPVSTSSTPHGCASSLNNSSCIATTVVGTPGSCKELPPCTSLLLFQLFGSCTADGEIGTTGSFSVSIATCSIVSPPSGRVRLLKRKPRVAAEIVVWQQNVGHRMSSSISGTIATANLPAWFQTRRQARKLLHCNAPYHTVSTLEMRDRRSLSILRLRPMAFD